MQRLEQLMLRNGEVINSQLKHRSTTVRSPQNKNAGAEDDSNYK